MHRQVGAIANRLSLRPSQRRSLEILDRIVELTQPSKSADRAAALAAVQKEFPSVTDFERDFPSLCFALATGVGKTRLMGAFISYLRLAYGVCNFFVLAPNLTIYNKLITDFTPNTPKYVFRGVAEFATEPPLVITGDTYEQTLLDQQAPCRVNIFNISKINSEVRGGKAPRIKRLSEYIGDSYFAYLANLPDLVLVMDESHRYRASAGVKAINELRPILGLELTATPFTESAKGPVHFKNVVYRYQLAEAMADGFVKEPAVVTRRNFRATGMSDDELENYVVRGLIDFDDVSYDDQADFLYDLAGQAVRHFRGYLSEADTGKVLQAYQRPIALNIHAQMHQHYWEKVEGYDVRIAAGFTPLKDGAFSASVSDPVVDVRTPPAELSKVGQIVYGGFSRCLYRTQRFQNNTERRLAVILDRDAIRWFKPLKDQFQICYRRGAIQLQYVPDAVAEAPDTLWILETKARVDLTSIEVAAKRKAAEQWCAHASAHAATYGGKPWKYALIPHDVVDENMSLDFLVRAAMAV